MKRWRRFSLIAAGATAVLLWWHTPTQAQGRSDHDFLDQVSRSKGIPIGKLKMADRSSVRLVHSGQSLDLAKVVDTDSQALYSVAFNSQGRTVNYAAEIENDKKAFRETNGKISPDLQTKVQASGQQSSAALPVSIWVNMPQHSLTRPTGLSGNLAQEMSNYLTALQAYTQPRLEATKNELRRAGANARAGKYGPALFAALTPSQIRQVARHPDVGAIYEQSAQGRFGDDGITTARAYRPWQLGNLGAGGRPAVHEDDGVSDYNSYLNNLTHPVIFFCASVNALCPSGKFIDSHASEVAGLMASTHPLYRGAAPNSSVILSANSQTFADADLVNAFEWAVGNSASVVNMSWGTNCPNGNQTFWSRYLDWAVRNLAITAVVASGNDHWACPGNMNVSSPGTAWSPITVGAIDDNDTGFWSGDFMAPFSRYVNPATGQEKPEVVAVGQDVTMTSTSGNIVTGNGTSYAAPLVAGMVTSMLNRVPGQRIWPETNKAVILAAAAQDVVPGQSQDGLGAVVGSVADETYRLGRYRNTFVSASSFNQSCAPAAGAECFNYLNVISATAGQRVRVAIAWDSNSLGSGGPDTLGADIDLNIIHPNNTTTVVSSASFNNTWEAVDFVAPVSGTYDIVIRRFSSETGWPGTYLGTAWAPIVVNTTNTGTIANFCSGESAVTLGATLGNTARTVNTANGGTYIDAYTGWATPQTGREGLLKLTLTTMRDITISDTNATLDLHLVQLTGAGCDGNPVTYNLLASTGNGPVTVQNLPAGTYYLIVDGANGAVGSTTVTINVAGP